MQNKHLETKGSFSFGKVVLWVVLIIMAVIRIFPLIWLLDFSLASSNEMLTSGLLIIPEKIQWGNYVKASVRGDDLISGGRFRAADPGGYQG